MPLPHGDRSRRLHVATEVGSASGHAPARHGFEAEEARATHTVVPAIKPAANMATLDGVRPAGCNERLAQPGIVSIKPWQSVLNGRSTNNKRDLT